MDSPFFSLPASVRTKIDRAFDVACGAADGGEGKRDEFSSDNSPRKKRRVANTTSDTQAGFIIDDADDQQGGFLIDDDDQSPRRTPARSSTSRKKPAHIALSRIPAALQILDLPPDDAEVLGVFRNAASGWASHTDLTSRNRSPSDDQDDYQMVSRDDWRAVCGVLFEASLAEQSEHESGGEGWDMDVGDEVNGVDSGSDEYVFEKEPLDEESSASEGNSDDDYLEGPSSSRTAVKSNRSRKGKGVGPILSTPNVTPRTLTARQTLECRKAFGLFFPDVDVNSDKLDNEKITIKDISKVAKLLNEKIKAEEVRPTVF